MEIQTKRSRGHDAGVEQFLLKAVVPGAVGEFCRKNRIAEDILPEYRMHDRDFARFMLGFAQDGAAANAMAIETFAKVVPNFPRDMIPTLFAHVAGAVHVVIREARS